MTKILIVDDDLDLVEIARLHLENAGYEVNSAHSRDEGLKAIKEWTPDLILLDIMMEHEDDGITMAQDLRREGLKTPIIMLTSMGRIAGIELDKDDEIVPVDEFLHKPVDPTTLIEKIKKLSGKETE